MKEWAHSQIINKLVVLWCWQNSWCWPSFLNEGAHMHDPCWKLSLALANSQAWLGIAWERCAWAKLFKGLLQQFSNTDTSVPDHGSSPRRWFTRTERSSGVGKMGTAVGMLSGCRSSHICDTVFALYLELEKNVRKLDESSCFLLQYT